MQLAGHYFHLILVNHRQFKTLRIFNRFPIVANRLALSESLRWGAKDPRQSPRVCAVVRALSRIRREQAWLAFGSWHMWSHVRRSIWQWLWCSVSWPRGQNLGWRSRGHRPQRRFRAGSGNTHEPLRPSPNSDYGPPSRFDRAIDRPLPALPKAERLPWYVLRPIVESWWFAGIRAANYPTFLYALGNLIQKNRF